MNSLNVAVTLYNFVIIYLPPYQLEHKPEEQKLCLVHCYARQPALTCRIAGTQLMVTKWTHLVQLYFLGEVIDLEITSSLLKVTLQISSRAGLEAMAPAYDLRLLSACCCLLGRKVKIHQTWWGWVFKVCVFSSFLLPREADSGSCNRVLCFLSRHRMIGNSCTGIALLQSLGDTDQERGSHLTSQQPVTPGFLPSCWLSSAPFFSALLFLLLSTTDWSVPAFLTA